MEFELSDTQKMMQQAARGFLSRECPPKRVRELMASATAYDPDLWQGLAEQGWMGMIVPEQYGGLGLGLVELAAVCEELGRAVLPGPFLSTIWATALVERLGTEPQKERYLRGIAEGKIKATVALLESSADWDPRAVALNARAAGDCLRLEGVKLFVPDAAVADVVFVAARRQGEVVVAAVDPHAQGVTIRAMPALDQTRKLYELLLAGVEVQPDEILSGDAEPVAALEHALRVAAVAVCAELVGSMQWVLETAVAYAQTRVQFGRTIGSFQAVQHQCADMLLLVESARSATYYAAWACSVNDPDAAAAVSIAKAYVSDAAREVGNRGIQVHGGIGFTWEHDLQLHYKRAKASEIAFGDATYHRECLAEQLLDTK